ncbi:MAG: ACP S-malonyltransferase [Opitutales bacterium]|nr:ACP S-malonyltransferase [Opitutales bacterium]MCH8539568.1 ACP S-malonyltransferase [Opitutales bacterium]
MKTAFLFAGQGAQTVGMGKSLYENSAAAKALYEEADKVLGWSLSEVSFAGPEELLTETKVCQPALFVHGMAGLAALRESGFTEAPLATLGLSLGEVTALTAAGVFTFADGLRVVARRGELMQKACEETPGAMACLIGGDLAKAQELCEECKVDMANLNCPGQIVISGHREGIDKALAEGKAKGFKHVIPLKVAGAYHSRLMESARRAFGEFLQEIPTREVETTVFTNTTGQAVVGRAAILEALEKQVVSPVRWEDCMRNAAALGVERFLEFGPGGVLAGLAKRTDRSWNVLPVNEAPDLASLTG